MELSFRKGIGFGPLTSHQLLWWVDSFVLRNPPLRQAPKRYRQQKQKQTIKIAGA